MPNSAALPDDAPLFRRERWLRALLVREGSTRVAALMRIGGVLLTWACWGDQLLPYKNTRPDLAVICALFWVSTTLALAGVWARLSTLIAAGVSFSFYYYKYLILRDESGDHHHTYFLASLMLGVALTPCGTSLSWDRLRAVRAARQRGAHPPAERGDLWGLNLIIFQVAMIYLWGAWDKTHLAYGERVEHYLQYYLFGSEVPFRGFSTVTAVGAWAVVALEYLLPFGLMWPRTRKSFVITGIALHALIYATVPVCVFSLAMMLSYLAFLDADAVHRWMDEQLGVDAKAG
jgi:hypothetical protein